ncbi:ANTAR domain-containing response regulator [Butyrivibrio sp. AE3004]|uniref:ANTAR domain-containing response regulator n=1 Tax=Butyrivibrio sp. AE3004 TaxID=1506994 RepID=UPI000493BA8D|nr:ANTAR domain-containing protein [Butyrivibrio sp. AE3004]
MQNIIVAFAKQEDAQNFKSILMRGGFEPAYVCLTGAQVLSAMENLGNGVVICGYRLGDMLCTELSEDMPEYFKMLLIASKAKADDLDLYGKENVVYLPTPLKKDDLFSTLTMMIEGAAIRRKKVKEKRRFRSSEDQKVIDRAKAILMERHNMTEPEAHKYLQKCSMDSGTSLLETAEMLLAFK